MTGGDDDPDAAPTLAQRSSPEGEPQAAPEDPALSATVSAAEMATINKPTPARISASPPAGADPSSPEWAPGDAHTRTAFRQRGQPVEERTLTSVHEPPASEPLSSGHILGGKYSVGRLLGSGGMGQVWKGEHILLGTPVAIKTMRPHVAVNELDRRRFLREARAASMIRHPNVVQVIDVGEERGLLYLVMEYLEGRSLSAWLREQEELPRLADVASIIGMILDALDAAHALGVIHRDLKPENVLLTEVAGKRAVKVVDFGLAHLDDALDAGPTLTSRDMIAGTPEYMSPEQCRSLVVTASSDLYSIGCVLTTLLQGQSPFHGSSAIETFTKHMFSAPPPLSRPSGAEPVPPLLERLRLDLLAKHPERRPRSAAEARARLVEAMSPEAEARRLPARKGGEPLGGRAARAPAWAAADPVIAEAPPAARAVGLLRLPGAGEGGLGGEQRTGLGAHGIELVDMGGEQGASVVVIDAGGDVDGACAALAALAGAGKRAVVCAEGLDQERMNALVAAGAADVVRYPVTADGLARKLLRVLKRGR